MERQPASIHVYQLPEWIILNSRSKIYNDRNGLTKMLGKANKETELILHDVFGAIQYKGQGVFIAGGAGVTPFISIFRSLNAKREIKETSSSSPIKLLLM